MKIDARKIEGPWDWGVTLDIHTANSIFLGYDGNGNPQFDTTRTELGELVFRAKYRGDRRAVNVIAKTVAEYLESRRTSVDLVGIVPPSKPRNVQPLEAIAVALGSQLKVRVEPRLLKKTRATPELKSMDDASDREEALHGAFKASRSIQPGYRILLLDDLYRSGASMREAARAVREVVPSRLYALALTRNRVRT